jgi:hypothetical protein
MLNRCDYKSNKIQQMNKIYFFTGLFVSLFLYGCSDETERYFVSSYQNVNWERIDYFDMQIHVHPGIGDEQYDPHLTIDRYYEEGFKILAFTPHDYDVPDDYIDHIYPWTELANIYEVIKDIQNPTEGYKTYKEIANEPFQNRDPVELGMVSVQGSEISGPHHINNLFSSFSEGENHERLTIQKIEENGGIAFFNHPGRYTDRWSLTPYWYVDKYLRFDVMIGQSIYNRIDSHPEDRVLFDKVVHLLGPERPIWLYGEDDMHHEGTLGWNRNVILLENFEPGSMHPDIQDGSAPDVKRALMNGEFYFWKPSEQYNRRAFDIKDLTVTDQVVEITINKPDLIRQVKWRTHNPELDETVTLHSDLTLSMHDVPLYANFVRAEIIGEEGKIYTQPIYINFK